MVKAAGVTRPQMGAFLWIYWAYVCCYLVRKNYPLLLPALNKANLLTTSQAGLVASIFEIVTGVVKFSCGVYVDRAPNPANVLSKCLLLAGASCLGMALVFFVLPGESMTWVRVGLVTLMWSCNGMGQAVAWPALARVFMNWFPDPAIRGFWYSMLATNQNLGGTMVSESNLRRRCRL
jgi:OPA family sugar phosphate sensor protein UhpC-like MFS transporter